MITNTITPYPEPVGTIGSSSTSMSKLWWAPLAYSDWCPVLALIPTDHAIIPFLDLCHLKHTVFQKFQVSAMESPNPLFSLILENKQHPGCRNNTFASVHIIPSHTPPHLRLKITTILTWGFQKQNIVLINQYLPLLYVFIWMFSRLLRSR